ncbi:MAG: pilin, partial [Patescibacteria group bacterium]
LGLFCIFFVSSGTALAACSYEILKTISNPSPSGMGSTYTTGGCAAKNLTASDGEKCKSLKAPEYSAMWQESLQCCCSADAPAATEKPTLFKAPDFQVEIPGLNKLSDVTCKAGENCSIPWIGLYIKGIYNYLVAIVGAVAAIVLMGAGVLWIMSRGEASKITQARELILGSITGIIILASTYLILLQVNPELVNLQDVNIKIVNKIEVTAINKAEIQGCVGKWATNKITGAVMSSEVSKAVKNVAATSKIDPCYFYAILSQESGNDIKAFGDDRKVANCDITARRKYICDLYPECCDKGCKDAACKSYIENNSIQPPKPSFDKSGNPTNLDLKYTYGFGLGQATYLNEQSTPSCIKDGKKGFKYFNVCYSFSDLLTNPEINLSAMASGTKSYYCPGAVSGSVDKNCFKKYAGNGAWAECTGGKKMKVYEACKQQGFDAISSKKLNMTY